jgi:hypothetical protein
MACRAVARLAYRDGLFLHVEVQAHRNSNTVLEQVMAKKKVKAKPEVLTVADLMDFLKECDCTLPLYRKGRSGELVPITKETLTVGFGLTKLVQSTTEDTVWDERLMKSLPLYREDHFEPPFTAIVLG